MRRCKSCDYWHKEHCYRYPPTMNGDGEFIQSAFRRPPVDGNDGCGEHKAKPTEKKPKETNPAISQLIKYYSDRYYAIKGEKPMTDGSDAQAAKKMVETYGIERAMELVAAFLYDPPRWNRDHACFRLRNIPAAIDVLIARGE